jgi:hypothetical protein
MGRPRPETGGGTPHNQGLSEFKVLRDRQGVGPRVQKPVEEAGKKQLEPVYSQERIDEVRKMLPDLTTEQIIRRLKREDERKEDDKRGRRRGFGFS